jgi:hypothetical protein
MPTNSEVTLLVTDCIVCTSSRLDGVKYSSTASRPWRTTRRECRWP